MILEREEGRRRRGRERGEERDTDKRNTDGLPPVVSQSGIELATQVCSLTGSPQPFGVLDDAPTNRATWPVLLYNVLKDV